MINKLQIKYNNKVCMKLYKIVNFFKIVQNIILLGMEEYMRNLVTFMN